MKTTLIFSLLATSHLMGASYTISNNDGPINTSSIVDNAGNFITGGTASIGYFSISDAEVQSIAAVGNLTSSFVIFTSGADGTSPVGTTSDIRGVFSTQGSGVDLTDTGNEFRSRNIYVLVTNAENNQALVYKYDQTFGTAEVNASLLMNGTQTDGPNNDNTIGGNLLLGGYDTFQAEPHSAIALGNVNPTFNLVAVPEPSSTALLGLGGLALIIRRRR